MLGQIAFNIASLAAILIMLSIGLQLVAGLLGVINIAHGELVLLGAYGAYAFTLAGGWAWSHSCSIAACCVSCTTVRSRR